MKQLIQDIKKGDTILEEVPAPKVQPNTVLIKSRCSLVSLGTERMLVEFGRAGLVNKARQQPDKVKQVIDKLKAEGVIPTLEAVFKKLEQPLPLGYSNVGVVEEVGSNVLGLKVGDRVVSNGHHAEYVSVPEKLCAKIPEGVSDEEAAFTVIGSIGLEGIRLINPTFGETVVVIGLGMIGLVTAQLLRANGCRVIGYDYDQAKVDIATAKGIEAFNPASGTEPVKYILQATQDMGADGVIITASNSSNQIIQNAAEMCRIRGRIVLVGVVGLNIRREEFYKKELTFQVSCSYGPGRYDDDYEQKGHDYPIGYVRWTEQRNFSAILHAISANQLDVKPLISERVPLESYNEIYEDMQKPGIIASLLIYPESSDPSNIIDVSMHKVQPVDGVFGIIGAGNFTVSTIVPAMNDANATIKSIASARGLTATTVAKKGNIANATSDYETILSDSAIDSVLITTRHNMHASLTIKSLEAGKHVFVEKPLCLNDNELDEIIKVAGKSDKMVVVGFNRRFAPLARLLQAKAGDGPKNIVATMNAGFIPPSDWVHDLEVGGGRIIGEACHYIDLCSFLAGSKVKAVCMSSLGLYPTASTDNASMLLQYENGSNAVINYFSNGSKAYSKERVEVYAQARTLVLDNWRDLKGYGIKGFSRKKARIDKGHKTQFKLFVESIKSGDPIIPFDQIVNTTRASFAAIKSMTTQDWVEIS